MAPCRNGLRLDQLSMAFLPSKYEKIGQPADLAVPRGFCCGGPCGIMCGLMHARLGQGCMDAAVTQAAMMLMRHRS